MHELRQQVARGRRLADGCSDDVTRRRLRELADEWEAMARSLERHPVDRDPRASALGTFGEPLWFAALSTWQGAREGGLGEAVKLSILPQVECT